MWLFDVLITAIICITIIGVLLLLGSIKHFPTITIHHIYEQKVPPEQAAMTEEQQKEYDRQLKENKDILSDMLGSVNKLFGGVDDGEDNESTD